MESNTMLAERTRELAYRMTDGVEVTLALSYALNRRSPVTPVVDLLFIRRAIASSLQTTLARFAHERGS